MIKHILLLIFLNFVVSKTCFAQGFKAAALLGMNASQIDGDNLYGFDKLGITAGGRLSYDTDKSYDFALEMLYSQRGSALKPFTTDPNEKIVLNYFEFPVVFNLRDWFIEKDSYYKVRAEAGLSYGYLFGIKAAGYDESYFKKHDVSWLLGAGLNFTKRFGISLRYTSSFFRIYKVPTAEQSILLSYFITLRTEMNF